MEQVILHLFLRIMYSTLGESAKSLLSFSQVTVGVGEPLIGMLISNGSPAFTLISLPNRPSISNLGASVG